jgi:hypothetical protein
MKKIIMEDKRTPREQNIINSLSSSMEKTLNSHGFSYQYSVIRRIHDLYESGRSKWILEGAEIPVETISGITQIDFVSRQKGESIFLIAECKRISASLKDKKLWCFVKAPYTWRGASFVNGKSVAQFETILHFGPRQYASSNLVSYDTKNIYDLGFEIINGSKKIGESKEINNSVQQVIKGLSGFINYIGNKEDEHGILTKGSTYICIPVIFTTAKLFVTEVDIGKADITKGHLPVDSVKLTPKNWIWFNENRSLNQSHNLRFNHSVSTNLSKYFQEFTRTVAIVSSEGIDEFLTTDFNDWLR